MEYKISKTLFSKECLLKVVYSWQEKVVLNIEDEDNNFVLKINENNSSFDYDEFTKDLQEQQLREILNAQFGSLREAIYNKAFEHFAR